MRILCVALLLVPTIALADATAVQVPPAVVSTAPTKPAACTPPDELTVTLPLSKAVVLNNILQDQDVLHKDWIDIARIIRAQLVGQCKETKH